MDASEQWGGEGLGAQPSTLAPCKGLSPAVARESRNLNFNVKSPDIGKTGGVKHTHEQNTAPGAAGEQHDLTDGYNQHRTAQKTEAELRRAGLPMGCVTEPGLDPRSPVSHPHMQPSHTNGGTPTGHRHRTERGGAACTESGIPGGQEGVHHLQGVFKEEKRMYLCMYLDRPIFNRVPGRRFQNWTRELGGREAFSF